MLKKRLLGGLCLLLAAMFCLSGCGGNEANENNQGAVSYTHLSRTTAVW